MASSKLIKKRISSIKGTRKITRTMEMVATAKSKRLVNRVQAAQPYKEGLLRLMSSLQQEAGKPDSPYLRSCEKPERLALLVVTANRGLCGEYNSSVYGLARQRYEAWRRKGAECHLYVIGKKGIAYFQGLGLPIQQSFTHIDDSLSHQQSRDICSQFMNDFASERYESVEIAATVYYSAGRQEAALLPFLPTALASPEEATGGAVARSAAAGGAPQKRSGSSFIYDPNADTILKQIVPLALQTNFYGILLEALASEQLYRRLAMKNSTEAAGDMIDQLTRRYNRIRQATITREIAEIVAGADAL